MGCSRTSGNWAASGNWAERTTKGTPFTDGDKTTGTTNFNNVQVSVTAAALRFDARHRCLSHHPYAYARGWRGVGHVSVFLQTGERHSGHRYIRDTFTG